MLQWTLGCMHPFKLYFPSDICSGKGLLDHIVALFLAFFLFNTVFHSVYCCSLAKSCLTLFDLMDYDMPGSSFLHCLPEFCSSSCPLSWWYCLTISFSAAPFFFCIQSLPPSESFPISQLFISGDQSTGASASKSVLSVNIQGEIPLGLTGLISLLSKGLSSHSGCTNLDFHW